MDEFKLNGTFPHAAEEISIDITSFTHPDEKLFHDGVWKLDPLKMEFPTGFIKLPS